jgi:hypothetical protein
MFELLQFAILAFELTQVMRMLPPSWQGLS